MREKEREREREQGGGGRDESDSELQAPQTIWAFAAHSVVFIEAFACWPTQLECLTVLVGAFCAIFVLENRPIVSIIPGVPGVRRAAVVSAFCG